MAFRALPVMVNNFSYPMIMLDGSIQELMYMQGSYFSLLGNDVSKLVSYTMHCPMPRTCI
jgi:hypothetical protein